MLYLRTYAGCGMLRSLLMDQVGGFDLLMTETKVRHGNTAGFLGVIIEVSLCVHIGIVTDDLDGVLVSTYGTVCTQTPELTVGSSFRSGNKRAPTAGTVGNIIYDTSGKSLDGAVLIDSNDLRRSGIFGTKTITAGEDLSLVELAAF